MNTFFTTVTLPLLGYEAQIRKVDGQAVMQEAVAEAFGEQLSALVAEPHLSAEQLHPEQLRALLGLGTVLNTALVRHAVVDLPALMAAYHANESTPLLGLGPDFAALVLAIRTHSGLDELDANAALKQVKKSRKKAAGVSSQPTLEP